MKRKYYMRGIGISMMVTALLIGISTGGKETLSEEEIKKRALQLGMVEEKSTVLSNLRGQETKETLPSNSEATENTENTDEAGKVEDGKQDREPDKDNAKETGETEGDKQDREPDKDNAEKTGETEGDKQDREPLKENTETVDNVEDGLLSVTIQVVRGDSSVSVSKALAEAGLVENATAFDRYLCNNGYDKRISIGTYEIVMGTTEEEIARIITRSKR